jgi:RimJ/RimL family protein N-acetyltransferase
MEKERHFDNTLRWVNTEDVSDWILIGDYPIARVGQEEWFERMSRGSDTDIIFAIELLDGTHIGQTGIHGIDHRHGFASTGSFLGEDAFRGLGYGTEASQLRAWYCFYVLGLRLLRSGYLEGNDRSAGMSERSGYVESGRIPKQYWKRGMYRDHIETVLTRERWLELSGGARRWGNL